MILVIDNYDSFTWNLVHLIGDLGHPVEVARNDEVTPGEALAMKPVAIVLSPGPCTPDQAGICLDLIAGAHAARQPLFGVCLGMQAIAQAFGGRVVRAPTLMHGKTSLVYHDGGAFFGGLPAPFTATRYHSLIAEAASLPTVLEPLAYSADEELIMALCHRSAPIGGVQFHPESIASAHGTALIEGFLAWAKGRVETSHEATGSATTPIEAK